MATGARGPAVDRTLLGLGVVLLLLALATVAALLATAPERGSERLAAYGAATMCLVGAVASTAAALPHRGASRWLWRWLGWMPGFALVPYAVLFLRDPAGVAATSRVSSPEFAVLRGLAALGLAVGLWCAWALSLRTAAAPLNEPTVVAQPPRRRRRPRRPHSRR